MVFKMRILFKAKNGLAEEMAQAIQHDQKCGCDKIPPAYPVESEKLLFLGMELGKKAPKEVIELCNGLTQQRCKNVAIFAIGSSFEGVEEVKSIIKSKGINIVGNVYECKPKGGFLSKPKLTDEHLNGAVDWSKAIVESLM